MKEGFTEAKNRVAEVLKKLGRATVSQLALELELTEMAVRQHLLVMEESGLVRQEPLAPSGRGRPAKTWRLTAAGHRLFPDHHRDLTLSLIDAMRRSLGEEAVDRVLEARAKEQLSEYRQEIEPASMAAEERLRVLAELRTREGYMAEVVEEEDGFLLIEHHCPICEAAKVCQGLCRGELNVFRRALGRDLRVERVRHLMQGGDRCIYRITPRRSGSRSASAKKVEQR